LSSPPLPLSGSGFYSGSSRCTPVLPSVSTPVLSSMAGTPVLPSISFVGTPVLSAGAVALAGTPGISTGGASGFSPYSGDWSSNVIPGPSLSPLYCSSSLSSLYTPAAALALGVSGLSYGVGVESGIGFPDLLLNIMTLSCFSRVAIASICFMTDSGMGSYLNCLRVIHFPVFSDRNL
jgi:hypothetical protein